MTPSYNHDRVSAPGWTILGLAIAAWLICLVAYLVGVAIVALAGGAG